MPPPAAPIPAAGGEGPAGAGRPSPAERAGKRKGNAAPPLPGGREAHPAPPGQGRGLPGGLPGEARAGQSGAAGQAAAAPPGRQRPPGQAAGRRRRRSPEETSAAPGVWRSGAERGLSAAQRLPLRGTSAEPPRGSSARRHPRGRRCPPAVPATRETGSPPAHRHRPNRAVRGGGNSQWARGGWWGPAPPAADSQ